MDIKNNLPFFRKINKKCPLRVVITEASNYIARSLAYRIFSDQVFGYDQEIILSLFDNNNSVFLESIAIEITACAPPLLKDVFYSDNPSVAFEAADIIFSIGTAREYNFTGSELGNDPFFRDSVLETKKNAESIERYAKKTAKVITLGNTAAKIISMYAPSIPRKNIMATTLTIQKFVASSIARKTQRLPKDMRNLIIWGSNSKNVLPYCDYSKINGSKSLMKDICNDHWYKKELPQLLESIFSKCRYRISEALALADHCKFLILGTPENEWISMIVESDGSYGVTPGVFFSFPVYCKDGQWQIVKGLYVQDYCKNIFKNILENLEIKYTAATKICQETTVMRSSKKPSRKSIIKIK